MKRIFFPSNFDKVMSFIEMNKKIKLMADKIDENSPHILDFGDIIIVQAYSTVVLCHFLGKTQTYQN